MAMPNPTVQVTVRSNTSGPSWTSGSFTPPANCLLKVTAGVMVDESASGSGIDPAPDLNVSGGGLTWTAVVSETQPNSWSSSMKTWVAQVGSSPSSMTVQVSESAGWTAYSCHFDVIAQTGHDQSSPVRSSQGFTRSSTGDGAWSVTLTTAPLASSMVIASMFTDHDAASSAATPASGWTELNDQSGSSGNSLQVQYRTGSTSTGVGWDDTASGTPNYTNGATVIEIAEAPVATITQSAVRAFNDDGSESAATPLEAENTDFTAPLETNVRLRVQVDADGDPSSKVFRLNYKKSTDSVWKPVPLSSPVAGSVDKAIITGSDDAQQITTTMTLTGTTIGASLDATSEWVGLRFQDIQIPVGATITAAYISVVPSGTGEDEPLVTIYMQDADNPGTFTTGASDISNRSRTSGVSWSSTDLGATGSSYHDSPSLSSIVQDVVNRGGWAPGNAMVVIIQGGATSTRDLTIESFENTGNNPPLLHIEYTVPSPIIISASSNITGGGENTTARLTAPSGKTTGDFQTGRAWDDENGTDSLDLSADKYTELEWCIKAIAAGGAANAHIYDFKVTVAGTDLDAYDETISWTIGSPNGTGSPTAQALTLTQLSAAASGGASTSVTTQALALTQQTAIGQGGASDTLDTQALTLTQLDASASGSANTEVTTQALTLTQQDAAGTVSMSPAVTTQALSLTQLDAVATGGASAEIEPISLSLTQESAGLVISSTGGIEAQALTLTQVDVAGSGGASAALDPIAVEIAQQDVTATVPGSGDVGTQALSLTQLDASASGSASASLDAIPLTLTQHSVSAIQEGDTPVDLQALTLTQLSVIASGEANTEVTTQALSLVQGNTEASGTEIGGGSVDSQALSLTQLDASASGSAVAALDPIVLSIVQQDAAWTAGAEATAEAQALSLTQLDAVASGSAVVELTPIALTLDQASAGGEAPATGEVAPQAMTLTQLGAEAAGGAVAAITTQALTLTQQDAETDIQDVGPASTQALTLGQNNVEASGDALASITVQALSLIQLSTGAESVQVGVASTIALLLSQNPVEASGSAVAAITTQAMILQILTVESAGLPPDSRPPTAIVAEDYFLREVYASDHFLNQLYAEDHFL